MNRRCLVFAFLFLFVIFGSPCLSAESVNVANEINGIIQFVMETKNEFIEIVSLFLDEAEKRKQALNEAVIGLNNEIDLILLWNTLKTIKSSHINGGNIDSRKLAIGAANGMLQSIDRWSRLENSEEFKENWSVFEGGLCGIGATMKKKGRYTAIVQVFKNSPAERAGIINGDIILSVDGVSIRNCKVDDVVRLVRGDFGTSVDLRIYRKDSNIEFDVSVTRERIVPELTTLQMKEIEGRKFAVIKIREFNRDAAFQFAEIGDEVESKNPDGIIIDLRGNPGGDLNAVSWICSIICGTDKVITIMEYASGSRGYIRSENFLRLSLRERKAFEGIPLVCLIDKGSASASEIMAACLRDNLGIKLIGETTYGKGVGQNVIKTQNGILFLTTFRWLSPSGYNIDDNGIVPDFEIEIDEEEAEKDPRFDKAIEVLNRYVEIREFQKKFLAK